ncbi:MAG: hypothetical protein QME68_07485, partial [Elusimicrobiota bacterium]|nr:hypothetical protein [Elusimicrobiota bacterium]
NAVSEIVKNMFVEAEQHRYTHILQTGGGKTFLAVVSALLLRIQTSNTQFVSMFTNTIDNAKDIEKHLLGIFGQGLGNVVVITSEDVEKARENPQQLREKLINASIVITTYDIWAGLVASTFAQLLDEKTVYGKQNIQLLNSKGIKTVSDARGRMSFEDATKSREALKILLAEGYGIDNSDISLPLAKICSAVADEIDFFSTIPMQALATSMGKYYT